MSTVERLYEEVMALSDEEREQLIVRLQLERLGLAQDVLGQWDREAEAAEAEIDAGGETVPWETVRARMFAKINAARRPV